MVPPTETEPIDRVRRHATALFADIVGSTALTERLGDEEAHRVISSCIEELRRLARSNGATLVQPRGDGILALFGVPVALEDSARAALNTAVAIRERFDSASSQRASVSIGISSGPMVAALRSGLHEAELDVVGADANLAKRLSDLAPAGEAYVSERTHAEVRDQFSFEELEATVVKGISEPVRVFALRSRAPRLHRTGGALEIRTGARLIGREEAIARIERGAQAAANLGRRHVVMLLGEAGVGKTRLLDALREGVSQRAGLLEARATSVGRELPFHAFQHLLRARFDLHGLGVPALEPLRIGLSELLGADSEAALPSLARMAGLELPPDLSARLAEIPSESLETVLFRSVALLCEAHAKRALLVLVFDDAHWIDDSSRRLLAHLIAVLEGFPVLFAIASRPDQTGVIPEELAALLPAATLTIDVEPLLAESANRMLDQLDQGLSLAGSLRARILELAAGNPLYLEGLVRSVFEAGSHSSAALTLPGTIRDLVLSQIDRLSPAARARADELAVIGEAVSLPTLAALSGEPEAVDGAIRELVRAELVREDFRGAEAFVSFRHPLSGEAVYDAMVESRRRLLHGRVAALLESQPGTSAARLAYHVSRSEPSEKMETYLLAAGHEAAQAAASRDALRFFRQAADRYLAAASGVEPERRYEIRTAIAQAEFNRGDYQQAIEEIEQLLPLLGHTTPAGQLGQALRFARNLVVFSVTSLRYRRSPPRRRATPRDQELIDFLLLRARAQVTADTRRFLFDSMEALIQTHAFDPRSLRNAAEVHAGAVGPFTYGGLSFWIADRCIEEALAIVDPADSRQLLFARVMNFVHRLLTGDWSDEHEISEQLLADGLRLGQLWDVSTYLGMRTMRAMHQGDFAPCGRLLARLRLIEEQYANDYARSNRLGFTAFVALKLGRWEEAERAAREYAQTQAEPTLRIQGLATLSQALCHQEKDELAQNALDEAERLLADAGRLPPFQTAVVERARTYRALLLHRQGKLRANDAERAAAKARSVARKVAWEEPEAFRLSALAARAAGRRSRADRFQRAAVSAAKRLGARPELARALSLGGPAEAEEGRRLARALGLEGRDPWTAERAGG